MGGKSSIAGRVALALSLFLYHFNEAVFPPCFHSVALLSLKRVNSSMQEGDPSSTVNNLGLQ